MKANSHSVLVIIYPILRTKKPSSDPGADYFDKLDATRIVGDTLDKDDTNADV